MGSPPYLSLCVILKWVARGRLALFLTYVSTQLDVTPPKMQGSMRSAAGSSVMRVMWFRASVPF